MSSCWRGVWIIHTEKWYTSIDCLRHKVSPRKTASFRDFVRTDIPKFPRGNYDFSYFASSKSYWYPHERCLKPSILVLLWKPNKAKAGQRELLLDAGGMTKQPHGHLTFFLPAKFWLWLPPALPPFSTLHHPPVFWGRIRWAGFLKHYPGAQHGAVIPLYMNQGEHCVSTPRIPVSALRGFPSPKANCAGVLWR